MQKTLFIILILLLSACGKTNKTEIVEEVIEETVLTAEQQPLSEAEAWELFDEFWVEFQRAVIEDDEDAIKGMCDISSINEYNSKTDIGITLDSFIIKSKEYKNYILNTNKDNKYDSYKYFENDSSMFDDGVYVYYNSDNTFTMFIGKSYIREWGTNDIIEGTFNLRYDKYELIIIRGH